MSATSPSSRPPTPPSSTPAGELTPVPQLSAAELTALAGLEAACTAHDGGRLKLEWGALRCRPADTTSDFCFFAGGELVGFAGIYQWHPVAAEICGMVHPDHRRQGIGAALYDAVEAELERRRPARALLIVDRALEASRRFALSRGGELDHSEHRMQQRRDSAPAPAADRVRVRTARPEDAVFVAACLAAAFEEEPAVVDPSDEEAVAAQVRGTEVIERTADGEPVGVLRVERDGLAAAIYGFAVLPGHQHQGYGRAALVEVTERLRRSGVEKISLEVLSTNDSALHLYETCGFDALGTEDYYAMPLPGEPGRP